MIGARVGALLGAVCVSSCTVVPPNVGPANVRFDQVVKRIKCDLLGAVYRKASQDPIRFGFLTQWSAKVHMTLTVDDQASISPGLTFTTPLAVSGTSFSFGAGGTVTGQVQRIEDYEFFLSFSKSYAEMTPGVVNEYYDSCKFSGGQLLESNFDFDSIIERAVSPVEAGLLKKGGQVGPAGSSTPPPLPANEAVNIKQALNAAAQSPLSHINPYDLLIKDMTLNPLFKGINEGTNFTILGKTAKEQQDEKEQKAKDVADAIVNAPKIASNVHEVIENVVYPLSALAATTTLPKKCSIQMERDRAAAISSAAAVAINKSNIDNAGANAPDPILVSFGLEQKARDSVLSRAQSMLDQITQCKEPIPEPPKPVLAVYDPIDLIQETVNFYITATGSIAPSWKLVTISAPSSSPLFAGTAKTTDAMIITMGRPNTDSGKSESSKAMDSSLSAALIAQSINSRLTQ